MGDVVKFIVVATYVDIVTNKQREPELKLTCKMLHYSGVVCSYLGHHTSSMNL